MAQQMSLENAVPVAPVSCSTHGTTSNMDLMRMQKDRLTLKEVKLYYGMPRRTMFRWLAAGLVHPINGRGRGRVLEFSTQEIESLARLIKEQGSPSACLRIASVQNLRRIVQMCKEAEAKLREAEDLVTDAVTTLWMNTGDKNTQGLLRDKRRP